MKKLTSYSRNTWRALGITFRITPKVMIGMFVITILTALTPIYQAKILGNIVNKIISSAAQHSPLQAVVGLILGYAAIWGAFRIANSFQLFLQKRWYVDNEHGLEIMILKKRAEIDLARHESPEFQNLLQRGMNRGFWPLFELSDAQPQMFAYLAVILVSSILTTAISPLVYIIILLSSIPGFIVQFKYGYRIWTIWGEHSERQRKFGAFKFHFTNRTGITQIKLLQNSKHLLSMLSDIMEEFKHDQLKADTKRFLYDTGASIVSSLGFGFALFLLIKNILGGSQNIGTLVFLVSALSSLVAALNQLMRQLAVQLEKDFYVNDIFEILDTKPYVVRAKHPVRLDLSAPPRIEFKNVSFKYEGREDWILEDVSLTIEPSERVALVGMNGAGKSTLVKLIARIYDPTKGDIFVNGVNLKEVDLDEWGSYLSVLLQDYMTYDLLAKESIAMGNVSLPLDENSVREMAKFSGADEFIDEWEKKYEQQLGKEFEGGIEPSKGQHQKLALARTLYRGAKIVILDEPTAAIDALSEMQIFESMEKAVKGNTLILITHRFNTTQNVDKILVLERGRVEEIGTHKELLKKDGKYKEMFESQAKAFRSEPALA